MLIAPDAARIVAFPAEFAPRFWVTIDTEEDFDWSKPFSRIHHGLASLAKLGECQNWFVARGVSPIYLVDWPVIEQADAAAELRSYVAQGAAEVGAQLHPWVTPPFEEVVNSRNSYTGNLPEDLQRAKLIALRDRITAAIGTAPLSYRAGRYGLGTATSRILSELGFACDTSVRSGFDYRGGDGPDYRHMPLVPYWACEAPDLLEVPLTTVFLGLLAQAGQGERAYHLLSRMGGLSRSLAARFKLAERVALTPEGIPADRACAAIDRALALGLPLLNFSFHSPSLEPGHTPYVRTAADLAEFYKWWDVVLDHLDRRGVRPTTVSEVVGAARQARLR
jgi:hypothetical protein